MSQQVTAVVTRGQGSGLELWGERDTLRQEGPQARCGDSSRWSGSSSIDLSHTVVASCMMCACRAIGIRTWQVGDQVLRFGSLDSSNHHNLTALPGLVQNSVGR